MDVIFYPLPGVRPPNVQVDERNISRNLPFPLEKLPECVARQIIEKMGVMEYKSLSFTSRFGSHICSRIKTKFPCYINEIEINEKAFMLLSIGVPNPEHVQMIKDAADHIRWNVTRIRIVNSLTSRQYELILKWFNKHQIKTVEFRIEEAPQCTVHELTHLLELSGAQMFGSDIEIGPEIFDSPVIQKLGCLSLDYCSISDNQLTALSAIEITMSSDSVSSKAINELLKQWKYENRPLQIFVVKFGKSAGKRPYHEFLHGLEANLIWSPEFHNHSLVSSISIDRLDSALTFDRRFFSLFRSKQIHRKFGLALSRCDFGFAPIAEELEIFAEILSLQDYLTVFGSNSKWRIYYS